jgi:hypothetical protein
MSDADLNALAASLAETAASIEAHIERRAAEIAEPQVMAAQVVASNQIEKQRREHESEDQRKDDLIRELRRQLDAAVRSVERLNTEVKETRAAVRRVEALRVWTNEDGKKFVFADELWTALAEAGSPAARALAETRQWRATDA